MKHLLFHTIALVLLSGFATAQNNVTFDRELQWATAPGRYTLSDGNVLEYLKLEKCTYWDQAPTLPVFLESMPLAGASTVTAEINNILYEPLPFRLTADLDKIGAAPEVSVQVTQERNAFKAWLQVLPLRKLPNGSIERVRSFSITLKVEPMLPNGGAIDRGGPFTTTSALSTGNIYKFGVASTGIYKLDYAFLKNELKISDLDNINPRSIRLFGNGGFMLPEKNSDERPDDVLELAIQVTGEADGKFDQGDFILFYATGPQPWFYKPSTTNPQLTIRHHLYDRNAWYFIKTGEGNGLRLQEQPSISGGVVTESFDDVARFEEDKTNLLDFNTSSQGSGKRWFGDYYYQSREQEYKFDFADIVPGSPARMRAEFAARCGIGSTVTITPEGGGPVTLAISNVTVTNNDAEFARVVAAVTNFTPPSNSFKVKVKYPEVGAQSEGWLDYIEVNVRRKLNLSSKILAFRDLSSLTQDITTYKISNANGASIWDITVPHQPALQLHTNNGGILEFGANTLNVLRSYVGFNSDASFPKPEKVIGKIANQNLHGIDNVDLVIIYHPDYESQAKQLAEHRKSLNGYEVAMVEIGQLANEFSSGAKDPVAIRDFSRMLLERNPTRFKFLLLMGDGSFDPRNLTNSEDNKDFIPVWETAESFSPISAFPSDDFYGLLSPDESGALIGALDIAIGRIPARNGGEAQAVVDKIIAYEKDPATLGDWRLKALYIADDQDGNQHVDQADKLANQSNTEKGWLNIEKIYFDAYQQIATSGGARFPDAKSAINANMFKGALIMQYVGHGGPRGWGQERVVDNNDIAGWENPNRNPLLITATCTFGGYDDYSTLTGGEQVLLKEKSGAVGLFTTVRSVYIQGNDALTDALQEVLFKQPNGQASAIGSILIKGKNTITSGQDNVRRFTLLGDPSMTLPLPEYNVATTKINGRDVATGQIDTIKALSNVILEGIVTDQQGNILNDYNGKVTVALYDKAQNLKTLGQDSDSPIRSFSVQRNILFKGSATVANGRFTIQFVVPKDINYNYGKGKISYYADNGTMLDAAGDDENIIIGGNSNQIQDDQAPIVKAFLNTDAFAFGGITNDDPKVLIKCADDYGMNVSGTSLGHDLTAVLDGNVVETIILNDFYESEKDNYKKGQAIYPLQNLTPGRHTLKVKGWDIANNPGEAYTEFIVSENASASLAHVLNYPNPFSTRTSFQFEHNMPGQNIDIQVSIFTVAGKLIKTISHATISEGFRVNDIEWDGRDDYGDILARGVYLYKVKVRGTNENGSVSTTQSDFEKLVIIK